MFYGDFLFENLKKMIMGRVTKNNFFLVQLLARDHNIAQVLLACLWEFLISFTPSVVFPEVKTFYKDVSGKQDALELILL